MSKGVRLQTLTDVRRFMAKITNQLYRGELETDRARTLGYLCNNITTVIRDNDLEQRLKTLEQQFENTNSK